MRAGGAGERGSGWPRALVTVLTAVALAGAAEAAPAPVGPPPPGLTTPGTNTPPRTAPGAPLQLEGGHVPAGALRPFGAAGPSVGAGAASVTVVLLDLPGGYRVDAVLDGVALTLDDPGQGFLVGTFRGAPRRFVQLQLVANGGMALLDAMVAVPDQERAVLAWDVVRDGSKLLAVRAPIAPSLATDLGADGETAARVKWGWGGLALVWVLGMLGAWAAAGRRR